MKNVIKYPGTGYYSSETIKGIDPPPFSEESYEESIKIINDLPYPIYIYSDLHITKIEPENKGYSSNQVIINYYGVGKNIKKSLKRFTIHKTALDKKMIFIKEIGILICSEQDKLNHNDNESVLSTSIKGIDNYICKALEYRIVNTGMFPLYFNVNDPSKEFHYVYVYFYGEILKIKIDNNENEPAICQLVIRENDTIIDFDIDKVFNKKETLFNMYKDDKMLFSVDLNKLRRKLIEIKKQEYDSIPYGILAAKEEEIENKYKLQMSNLELDIISLKKSLDILKKNHSIENEQANSEISILKYKLSKYNNLLEAEMSINDQIIEKTKSENNLKKMEISYDLFQDKKAHDYAGFVHDTNVKHIELINIQEKRKATQEEYALKKEKAMIEIEAAKINNKQKIVKESFSIAKSIFGFLK